MPGSTTTEPAHKLPADATPARYSYHQPVYGTVARLPSQRQWGSTRALRLVYMRLARYSHGHLARSTASGSHRRQYDRTGRGEVLHRCVGRTHHVAGAGRRGAGSPQLASQVAPPGQKALLKWAGGGGHTPPEHPAISHRALHFAGAASASDPTQAERTLNMGGSKQSHRHAPWGAWATTVGTAGC
jgi:hypothetical protein